MKGSGIPKIASKKAAAAPAVVAAAEAPASSSKPQSRIPSIAGNKKEKTEPAPVKEPESSNKTPAKSKTPAKETAAPVVPASVEKKTKTAEVAAAPAVAGGSKIPKFGSKTGASAPVPSATNNTIESKNKTPAKTPAKQQQQQQEEAVQEEKKSKTPAKTPAKSETVVTKTPAKTPVAATAPNTANKTKTPAPAPPSSALKKGNATPAAAPVSAKKNAAVKAPEPESESEEEEEESEEDEEEGDSVEDSSEMDEDDSEEMSVDEEDDDEEDDEEDEEDDTEGEVTGDNEEDSDDESSTGFEQQSSDEEGEDGEEQEGEDDESVSVYDSADDYPDEEEDEEDDGEGDKAEEHKLRDLEDRKRFWQVTGNDRAKAIQQAKAKGDLQREQFMHVDDLSSDDEEDAQANTIGRVPLHWYDSFDHIGYTIDGKKLAKRGYKDRIDEAIEQRDDEINRLRRIYDMYNNREIVLTERELEIIRRIQNNAFAHPEFNDTPDYVDYFTHEKELMPLSARDDPKARFVPSKWELMKVMKIAKAIKEGRYVFSSDKLKQNGEQDDEEKNKMLYLIWNDAEDDILADSKRNQYHLPAPKMPLPGHAESYNPPPEYLLTEEEQKAYDEQDPEDRKMNFVPKKHDCLRHVGAYQNFVRERFERCLDLYLCPRKLKKRLNINPESLIPKLPHPRELKPFPNSLVLQYLGHKQNMPIRCLTISPDGQYLVSGSDDGSVRLWEVDTCLCKYTWNLGLGAITGLAWNPDPTHHLLVVSAGKSIVLITTGTGDADSLDITESQLSAVLEMAGKNSGEKSGKDSGKKAAGGSSDSEESESSDDDANDDDDSEGEGQGKASKTSLSELAANVKWTLRTDNTRSASKGVTIGPRVELTLSATIAKVSWHHKGDYFVALCPTASAGGVISVHQLSKAKSQFPFRKTPGKNISCVNFHPSLPCLIVATQQHVKLYHLIEQKLVKKLLSNCKWLSSMDVHSSGDHIVVGSYDRRVVWFDLDLSSTPYKTLKFHEKAVRDVKFHRRYPLLASASDDGNVHIFHSMVYNDMSRNPMIVPLKVLKGHGVVGDMGVCQVLFHPRQPWVFSAGADGVINLYQDI